MVTPVAKSSSQTSAFNANKPAILARNLVRDTSIQIPRWTTGGQSGSTDFTDPNRPVTRLYDGRLYYGSAPSSQSTATYYLNFRLPSVSLDAIFFEVLALTHSYDITFQLADSADFLTNLINVASWTGVTGTRRRCAIASSTLYTGADHARLRFVNTTGQNVPAVGEVFVAASRQLSRKFDIPYDDAPLASEVREFVARNRAVTRYVDARGFRDLDARATPTGSDTFGLDDVATFRGIFTDCDHGTRPIVFIENPQSAPNASLFGFGGPENKMPLQGPFKRMADFVFGEQPPFLGRET